MKQLIFFIAALAVTFTVQATEVELTSDNTVILDEAVSSESVGKVMREAKALDAKLQSGYPIYLFLYTPGGSIQAGAELIEYLEGLNRPVHTVTLFAASMGFQIVQHMGKRYVMKYGVLMSHKARGSFSGTFGGGVSQMDTRYSLWLRRIILMDEQTVKRTGGKQTLKTYINAYSPELWLNGAEAV
jgi:ATP-dependent protease ClpP protease subunit